MKPHRVVILATAQVVPFDLTAPLQIFRHVPGNRYATTICGSAKGIVYDNHGLRMVVEHGLEAFEAADTILIPGSLDWNAEVDAATVAALRDAHACGVRLASICTGAFILARTGLLDGRRATTHWACAHKLAELHPTISVDPQVLYVDEGSLLTSAGVTAGIDMCLHMIRRDFGQSAANHAARMLVASAHRSGCQAQFIDRPMPPDRSRRLDRTRQWILENLDRDWRVSEMAGHAGLAVRSFARRFESETGVTPLQWIIEQRVKHAQTLLESTSLPVEIIAGRCGFGSVLSLRQHFKRVTQLTPAAYRKAFAAQNAGVPADISPIRAF